LTFSASRPAFFVDVHYPGITFGERGFILLPGEKKHFELAEGKNKLIKKKNIEIFSLNKYLKF
jgi:hypothetical protein